jgi:hypothetical protein
MQRLVPVLVAEAEVAVAVAVVVAVPFVARQIEEVEEVEAAGVELPLQGVAATFSIGVHTGKID